MSLLASCLVCKICVAFGPAFLLIDACVLELAWKQKFNKFAFHVAFLSEALKAELVVVISCNLF
jgi:hypothetical protein